jgi:uncharacterized protein YbjT (DUF2867 family)
VRVMVVGATGFIGSRLARSLHDSGHQVVRASRSGPDLRLDYTRLPEPGALRVALTGVDVVINAVGILRERGAQTFDALHDAGPRALFAACNAAGVKRVIQISALGAEERALARYHRSKYAADEFLMRSPLDWVVVRPSLVYGEGGSSARMFDMLASLPLVPLPGRGEQRVQPVHIDDLVQAVVKLSTATEPQRRVIDVVGPWALTLRDFLVELRHALGYQGAPTVRTPMILVRWAASLCSLIPGSFFDRETLGMLERGNVAGPQELTELLGRRPRDVSQFVPAALRESRRLAAALAWLLPLLRSAVAATWLIAAAMSAGLYPVQRSLELLVDIGLPAAIAPAVLWTAIAIDLTLGILTLLPRRPGRLWDAQIAIVIGYTAIISWRLPHLWLEPFGPVAKNLPILAALLLLRQFEPRR